MSIAKMSQSMANFFVEKCRTLNSHKMSVESLMDRSIYN